MGIGKNILQGVRDLFGKSTSNQTPANLDIIRFNSASQQWELVSGIVGQAVQSSSNVGTGEGLAKARIGDDLPFRSLTTTSKISLTGSADEIEIDIGTLLISDIQGLQTALDNLEPPFLISDITGLQTALDSKVENGINIGTGAEVFANKAGVNLRFRRLIDSVEIIVTQNTNDLVFSIGAIAISKITGLQTELDDKLESPIAISDTTGLQTALDSKLETLTNVGVGVGKIAKAKVGVNNDIKSILAGAGITINDLTDEIEIVATAQSSSPSLLFHNANTEIISISPDYFALCGADIESSIEVNSQNSFPVAVKLQNLTIAITTNTAGISTARIRKNGADGNQVILIPASTTGIFRDVTNSDDFGLSDLGNYQIITPDTDDITVNSWACEVVNQ